MTWQLLHGDAAETLATLPAASVQCVITSPPYFGLRDYGAAGQIGLEPTIDAYLERLVAVFDEVRRVLRDDGTLWCNMGDSYNAGTSAKRKPSRQPSNDVGYWLNAGAMGDERVNVPGLKPKDLMMMPARLALALQEAGWWLRSDIIWSKNNPMPESVTDRPTTSHEHLFLLTKRAKYFYDVDAIREPQQSLGERHNGKSGYRDDHPSKGGISERSLHPAGRNAHTVWTIPSHAFPGAHFATFPPALVEPCILAGTSHRGACRACGAPWRRVSEHTPMVIARSSRREQMGEYGRTQASGTMVTPASSVTTGWAHGCSCQSGEPIPCVVLDPFSGAGTVPLVADRLDRHGIGIEIKEEYVAMARKRLTDDAPLLAPWREGAIE